MAKLRTICAGKWIAGFPERGVGAVGKWPAGPAGPPLDREIKDTGRGSPIWRAPDDLLTSGTGRWRRLRAHPDRRLPFLKQIDRGAPKGVSLHLIVDNYATHKHAAVRAWLAKRPRFVVHFTPTGSSWMRSNATLI